jgi:hypothetical protein
LKFASSSGESWPRKKNAEVSGPRRKNLRSEGELHALLRGQPIPAGKGYVCFLLGPHQVPQANFLDNLCQLGRCFGRPTEVDVLVPK